MNKIKILSPQEAQKIAAGEVVERPASVVKEIIENSIDAGATQISLYLEKAGKNLIRIVDNGNGMSHDDAKLCFTNHATSKISKLDDLLNISSFGFRGEALASISAVSKITLITKTQNSDLGIKLEYESLKFVSEENISCSVGTDLKIHNLFYNTPARKKFLKQDETEYNQIQQTFHAFCLSNIDIHFKLFNDDKLILNAPATQDLKQRVGQIWGHNFSQNLIQLSVHPSEQSISKDGPYFSGLISNHNFWRYGRQQIFFFVNKRFIKNKELSKALLKGYLNVLPPARFPAAFIFINLNNCDIDINVHPRKEEVQFSKPKTVEINLQKLVTQTLESNLSQQLKGVHQDTPYILSNVEGLRANKGGGENGDRENKNSSIKQNLTYSFSQKVSPDYPIFTASDFEKQNEINKSHTNFFKTEEDFPSHVYPEESGVALQRQVSRTISINKQIIIGQFLNTYILIETDEGLIIIDQHAAHERILYEKFLKNFEKKEGINLLFPEILNLPEKQIKIILNEKDFFLNQGIEIDQISNNEIAIKTSPPKIQNHSLKELILETIAFIEENENIEQEVFRKKLNEHMHSQMSCKMAVRAGDKLTIEQMQKLIDDLQQTNNRFICAHGRPTTWSLTKYQIEKNFKRK